MQIELNYEGDTIEGHSHKFDHQHLLSVGEVDVTVDGETTRFKAPSIVFIAKNKNHSMRAVSDYTLGYCIHPIRNGERVEDIVCPHTIPKGVDIDGVAMFLADDYAESFDKEFTKKK